MPVRHSKSIFPLKGIIKMQKRIMSLKSMLAGIIMLMLLAVASVYSQAKITTPKDYLGFNAGDDYKLINYKQLTGYWQELAKESPRVHLTAIGKTAEGREQIMAIITSPENYKKINEYRNISKKLALAENLSDAEARELARKGKAVVWIDGGLHATEVVGANQLVEMAYQMASLNDDETMRFLDDVILLLVPANPDGMDLVADWYMKDNDPKKRTFSNIPRLYQKYVGHDNNRDFYLNSQPETVNMSKVMFIDWFPQIMYNHHQSGPRDMVVFVPPFRDPAAYVYDPLLVLGVQAVGTAMHNRLAAENKPGAGMRSVSSYSIWYNGSLRTVGYYHNQIGMLTEINGSPTPMEIAFNPDRQLMTNDAPFPIKPQEWHFRQSIDYSISLNRAVIDYASRNRETVLYNRYLMGKNAIEKGNRDSWTIHPKIVEEVKEKIKKEQEKASSASGGARQARTPGIDKKYYALFNLPEKRDPRGYILPADQPDFPTAVKFANALIKSGIKVLKASDEFKVKDKVYPANSIIVKTNQAFRPHILDMFEPQDHPNDFKYENGPPIPPYDNAGWTLAYQMGVKFDRILDAFDGPFTEINGPAKVPAGKVESKSKPAGYLLAYNSNDAVIAVNRLIKEKKDVLWCRNEFSAEGKTYSAGTFFIPLKNLNVSELEKLASELGINFESVKETPSVEMTEIKPVRIGLWDRYGGSMNSGWTRWILEQFEFPYEVVYPQALNKGGLKDKFDLLVFVSGAIPPVRNGAQQQTRGRQAAQNYTIPEEYKTWTGNITADTTLPRINEFIKEGGTVVTIGSSVNLAYQDSLSLSNHMVDSNGKPLAGEQYYIPASVLEMKLNTSLPVAYGLPERLDVLFENSPVFRLNPESGKNGITEIAQFDTDKPLKSGWAWGQDKLYGGTGMAEAKLGRGTLYLFGPEILFRGQSHGTFKLLFNSIYLSGSN